MMTLDEEYQYRTSHWSDIYEHLPYLNAVAVGVAVRDEGGVIVELGVRTGNSTAAFLHGLGGAGHLISVDVEPPHVPADWADGNWTVVVGDDLDAGTLTAIRDAIGGAPVDAVFIDTSHTYAQTIAELETYHPLLRPGGKFLLHDTELEHPEAATDVDPPFPVAAAIRDWMHSAPGVVVEWRTGNHGLAVITIP